MIRFLASTIFALSLFNANLASANNNVAGIMASNGCVNCHGAEGQGATVGNIPPLIGRSNEFLSAAMEGYKKGTLQGTVMNRVMKSFNEEEISFLASYFSSMR